MSHWKTNVRTIYAQFRAAGYLALPAMRSARIVSEFRQLESDDDSPDEIGAVRIRLESDDISTYDDLIGDDMEGYRSADGRWRSAEECEKEFRHMLDTYGVWGSIGEVWDGATWKQVDSCWAHTGYRDASDPVENAYVVDHMESCIRESEALRACSPLCDV